MKDQKNVTNDIRKEIWSIKEKINILTEGIDDTALGGVKKLLGVGIFTLFNEIEKLFGIVGKHFNIDYKPIVDKIASSEEFKSSLKRITSSAKYNASSKWDFTEMMYALSGPVRRAVGKEVPLGAMRDVVDAYRSAIKKDDGIPPQVKRNLDKLAVNISSHEQSAKNWVMLGGLLFVAFLFMYLREMYLYFRTPEVRDIWGYMDDSVRNSKFSFQLPRGFGWIQTIFESIWQSLSFILVFAAQSFELVAYPFLISKWKIPILTTLFFSVFFLYLGSNIGYV